MAATPLVLGLLAALFAFASSGILPGPVGYNQGYSFSQSQTSSSDNNNYYSSSSSYNSVTVTPPQCSLPKRMSYYEVVKVPFLCQRMTGRTMPLPANLDQVHAQALMAMKADGWTICQTRVTVPVYRYQRLPVCCPGTKPYGNGACISTESRRVAEGTQGPCLNDGRLIVINGQALCQCRRGFFGYRCQQAVPGPVPTVPTPGQLLVSSLYNRGQAPPPFPVFPPRPPVPTVQGPRPLKQLLSRLPEKGVKPGSLIGKLINKGRVPPGPFMMTKEPSPMPNFVGKQPPMPPTFPPNFIKQNFPTSPIFSPSVPMQNPGRMSFPPNRGTPSRMPPGPRQTQRENELARYIAAVMYQKLLQEGLERQLTLRKQLEETMKKKYQQQQQVASDIFNNLQRQESTDSQNMPTTDPRPIPPPPLTEIPSTTLSPEEELLHDPLPPDEELIQGQDLSQSQGQGSDGMTWSTSDGILGSQPSSTGHPQMFGNGPGNFPPGSQPDVLTLQDIEQNKQKTESLVNGCLTQSGITRPLQEILEARDREIFHQVCSNSPVVGPCIMTQAESTFGHDRQGLIGRQMLQSVLMFLGQICARLESMEAAAGAGTGGMTSQPIFPNPPPSLGSEAVTTVKPEAASPVNVEEEPAKKMDQPQVSAPASGATDTHHSHHRHGHSNDAHAQVQESEVNVVEVAFPLWMILAIVGGCAALLLIGCITTCLYLRCRRKKKSVELDREPEKLPIPAVHNNFYAATPCMPPPEYHTTPVKQTLGGEEEEEGKAEKKEEAKADEKAEKEASE